MIHRTDSKIDPPSATTVNQDNASDAALATDRKVTMAVFDNREQAERAIVALKEAHFPDDQVGLIYRSQQVSEVTTEPTKSVPPGDPAMRVGTGAVVGGILGALAALAIPGIGPVAVGGALIPLLGASGALALGATAGAVTGGVIGGLTELGVSADEARYANARFEEGWTIVTVNAGDREKEAYDILDGYGPPYLNGDHTGMDPNKTENPGAPALEDELDMPTPGRTPQGAIQEWNEVLPLYRDEWDRRWGGSGGPWDEVEPAYRFGYDTFFLPMYRGRSWSDVEADLRRDWEARGESLSWDRARGPVREAWVNNHGQNT